LASSFEILKGLDIMIRTLAAASAVALTLLASPAEAQRHGGGWHHGGGHHNHYRGPSGLFWGGLGIAIGLGMADRYYERTYAPTYYYTPPVYPSYVVATPPPVIYSQTQALPLPSPVPVAAVAPDPIFYPRNGQSQHQIEADRQECNRWATTQQQAMADASVFHRATLACMDGRGYTSR
jgi:hypothetical protein